MPGIEKLHLEDALEDSPQTRSLLSVFEKDAMRLKKYTTTLHNCCQRILSAQNELCAATQALAQQLRSYEVQKFPLESDSSILTETLKQFASYLDDVRLIHQVLATQCSESINCFLFVYKFDFVCFQVSSIHQVLSTQYSESMMYPLSKFLQADIEEVSTMYEMFQLAAYEHDQSLTKYMKLPKKKEDRARHDINEDLYVNRKKFHQTALHYFSSLNSLQYKRKCFLLEPMMGYLHAQRAFFQMGNDAVVKPSVEEFLTNMNASVQGVQRELGQETQKTVQLIDNLEQQSAHLYHAEPLIDMPYIPPITNLTQKAGYLFGRSKPALLAAKWDKQYYFTQGGNLMRQAKEEIAGSLVLDLNEPRVLAEPSDADDRRYVFQITMPNHHKKSVILQAENDRERDEWILTLNNIIREGGYTKGNVPVQKKQERSNSSASRSDAAGSEETTSDGAGTPITPPSTPGDVFLSDTPIQFDMISPSEESRSISPPRDGPPKRINPFDQSTQEINVENDEHAAFCRTFVVRFLGSMEVKSDRGEQLVHATMRQILAARAIHNIFKMTEARLSVSNHCMRLVDPSSNSVRTVFALEDISYWGAHAENNRLFAFITRNKAVGQSSYACHVFECNSTAEEICQAITTATQIAFQALMEKKQQFKKKVTEKQLLLSNIEKMSDAPDGDGADSPDISPPLSPDGKYLILADFDQLAASPESTDPSQLREHETGDGDERRVEGAECESEA